MFYDYKVAPALPPVVPLPAPLVTPPLATPLPAPLSTPLTTIPSITASISSESFINSIVGNVIEVSAPNTYCVHHIRQFFYFLCDFFPSLLPGYVVFLSRIVYVFGMTKHMITYAIKIRIEIFLTDQMDFIWKDFFTIAYFTQK